MKKEAKTNKQDPKSRGLTTKLTRHTTDSKNTASELSRTGSRNPAANRKN